MPGLIPSPIAAFAFPLVPDFACGLDLVGLLPGTLDLRPQSPVALCPIRQQVRVRPLGQVIVERGRGNRQVSADRLDPKVWTMSFDEERSCPRPTVKLRLRKMCGRLSKDLVGLLRRAVRTFRRLHLLGHLWRDTHAVVPIDRGLLDPAVQRPPVHSRSLKKPTGSPLLGHHGVKADRTVDQRLSYCPVFETLFRSVLSRTLRAEHADFGRILVRRLAHDAPSQSRMGAPKARKGSIAQVARPCRLFGSTWQDPIAYAWQKSRFNGMYPRAYVAEPHHAGMRSVRRHTPADFTSPSSSSTKLKRAGGRSKRRILP